MPQPKTTHLTRTQLPKNQVFYDEREFVRQVNYNYLVNLKEIGTIEYTETNGRFYIKCADLDHEVLDIRKRREKLEEIPENILAIFAAGTKRRVQRMFKLGELEEEGYELTKFQLAQVAE